MTSFSCAQTQWDRHSPTTEKEKIRLDNESSLSFCLYSDMLTAVSVIFSLCESDIQSVGLSDILFAAKLAKRISLGVGE